MVSKKAILPESEAQALEVETLPVVQHHAAPALPPTVQQRDMVLMPATTLETAMERYQALVGFVKTLLHENVDYGIIPGTGKIDDPDPTKRPKPVLLKPGGEKLCMFFGLRPEFLLIDTVKDWDGGIFYFEYKCVLYRGDFKAGEGVGSCNSKERKYRYRNSERVCPACGKATIIKGKAEFGGGWICFSKKGGCGEKFHERAPEIVDQEVGQVENQEPFELINTLQKMAQKRAFMAAVITTVNASEFFTQDLEDFDQTPGEPAPSAHSSQKPAAAPPQPPAARNGEERTSAPQSSATGQQTPNSGTLPEPRWFTSEQHGKCVEVVAPITAYTKSPKEVKTANGGTYKQWGIKVGENWANTTDGELFQQVLVPAKMSGAPVRMIIRPRQDGNRTYHDLLRAQLYSITTPMPEDAAPSMQTVAQQAQSVAQAQSEMADASRQDYGADSPELTDDGGLPF